MKTRNVAGYAALIGGLGWLAKLPIMAVQGGPDPNSIAENVAFFMGVAGVLVAAASTALYLARARSMGVRIAAAVAGLLVASALVGGGQAALSALPGSSWVQEEAIFGVVGLLALVLAVTFLRRPSHEIGAATTPV